MRTIYAGESFPTSMTKSLFLAGPSPRNSDHHNWRAEAIQILQQRGYDGDVYLPLPRDGIFPEDYIGHVDWEQNAMERSDIVVFWIPRDLEDLPGFSTNVEFGQKCSNRNIVLGYPEGAPKTKFLQFLAEKNLVKTAHTLEHTLQLTLDELGDGALREGGECQVPLYLWKTPHFADWLQSQKSAGNRLDGCQVKMAFGVGPNKSFLLYWSAHVDIYVAAEGRNKSNEVVVSRPDISQTVGYQLADNLHESKVVLIREFRSTARTHDGFIREVPGGSGFREESPIENAASEFHVETGLRVDKNRFRNIGTRQLSATSTAHQAHVFAVELTKDEISILQNTGTHGDKSETELTYVEVFTVAELLEKPITDWCNLGMICAALKQRLQ